MRVFQNDYFESLWLPLAKLGYPPGPRQGQVTSWASGRVRVVNGQVGQVRLG